MFELLTLFTLTICVVFCSESGQHSKRDVGKLFLRNSDVSSDLVVVAKAFGTLKGVVGDLQRAVDRLEGDGFQRDEGSKNHALRKPATQSSTYHLYGTTPLLASIATDGDRSGNAYKIETTHTKLENNPWWTVDLRQEALVSRIVIQNRHDCCGSRLRHVRVTVGNSNNHMQLCATFPGPGYDGQLLTLHCDKPVRGRYVMIQQMCREYLQLAEVEVYSD